MSRLVRLRQDINQHLKGFVHIYTSWIVILSVSLSSISLIFIVKNDVFINLWKMKKIYTQEI